MIQLIGIVIAVYAIARLTQAPYLMCSHLPVWNGLTLVQRYNRVWLVSLTACVVIGWAAWKIVNFKIDLSDMPKF